MPPHCQLPGKPLTRSKVERNRNRKNSTYKGFHHRCYRAAYTEHTDKMLAQQVRQTGGQTEELFMPRTLEQVTACVSAITEFNRETLSICPRWQ